MPYAMIEQKLRALPANALEDISAYIDYLAFKFGCKEKKQDRKKGFGCLKDIPCKMSPDFDAPLDDFAEYM